MIRRVLVVAILLILIGGIGSLYTAKSQKKESEKLEEVIEETSFDKINLHTDNADIILSSTTDNQAKIELHGYQSGDELLANVVDQTLDVRVNNKSAKLFSFDFFSPVLSLHIYVPEKIYDTIQIKSTNGSIEMVNIEGKNFDVFTNNGKMTLNHTVGNSFSLDSDNGQIKMNDVTSARLQATTDNGSITLNTEDLDQSISLYTDNGEIDIQSASEPTNATFDIKTDNREVTFFGEKDWAVKTGNGENDIKLHSNNGNITLSH